MLEPRRISRAHLVVLAVTFASACGGQNAANNHTKQGAMNGQPVTFVSVTTNKEARAAVGTTVRVRGTLEREKLGDTINIGDLSVRCLSFRFPDDSVGGIVTAEGTLEIVVDEPVAASPTGEMSQGVTMEGSTFALRNCLAHL